MFKKIILFVVITSLLISKEKFVFSHSIKSPELTASKKNLQDSIKILALMVEFQNDEILETSGNGKFDLSASSKKIIDSPPHDSKYFSDHLLFAKNYFSRVSNNKLNIDYTIFPTKVTVSKKIDEYSLLKNKTGVSDLILESWQIADSLEPNFNFQNFDFFIIFHAGVGQDIDLISIYGYNPTPYDMPSLYFSLSSFKKNYGSDFDGIKLKNSNFKITNCAVLPETDSRIISSAGSNFLIQLSINGILAGSIGSFLGLPDLYDTKTGGSAIGRFGLMDGQSMFSFSGICPPEPSAWEKYFLGWSEPKTIFTKDTTITINSVGFSKIEDEIIKVQINSKEYFLIENRNRDPEKDGVKIKLRFAENEENKIFLYDSVSTDSLYGVITDFDNPDWSLPGYITKNYFYDGGILIWHIDEKIIEENYFSNNVNTNKYFRGVDLEEADGFQDIGEYYGFTSAGVGSEDGTVFDFWFNENLSPQFKNLFSSSTTPDSKSNFKAKSGVKIGNFSKSGNKMNFDILNDETSYKLEKIIKLKSIANNILTADFNNDGTDEIIYSDGDSIFVLKDNFQKYFDNEIFSNSGGKNNIAIIKNSNNQKISLVAFKDSTLKIFSDSLIEIKFDSKILLPPIIRFDEKIIVSTNNGIYQYFEGNKSLITNLVPTSVAIYDTNVIFTTKNELIFSQSKKFNFAESEILNANFSKFLKNGKNYFTTVIFLKNKNVSIINFDGDEFNRTDLNINVNFQSSAFVDFDKNSEPDIVLFENDNLKIFNSNGSMISGFPFKSLDIGNFVSSSSILADKNQEQVILFGSSNGQIYGLNQNGKLIENFPIQSSSVQSSPIIFNNKICVANSDSTLSFWNTNEYFKNYSLIWSGEFGNYQNTNLYNYQSNKTERATKLLPKEFAYNYPNPVYDGKTFLRYYLTEDSKIEIKLLTLTGELIKTISQNGFGNLDNEIQLDLSNYQTGVYIAQIIAESKSKKESVNVKIAVLK